jgi:hemerythrin-like domain-containing protein
MMFRRSTPRLLHDEHLATLSTLARVESLLLQRRGVPPGRTDAEELRMVDQLSRMLTTETAHHFDFEEQTLFPMLAERGEADLADILREEHDVLRETAGEIVEIAKGSLGSGFSEASWADYRRLCAELVERLRAHIQKEEMALLPILEDVLDADFDAEIAARHSD